MRIRARAVAFLNDKNLKNRRHAFSVLAQKVPEGPTGICNAVAVVAILLLASLAFGVTPAHADEPVVKSYQIAAQHVSTALKQFAAQSDMQLIFSESDVGQAKTTGINGNLPPREALNAILKGTNLEFEFTANKVIVVTKAGSRAVTRTSDYHRTSDLRLADDSSSVLSPKPSALKLTQSAIPTGNEVKQPQESPTKIEEIIVTAQKRSEKAQDVPASLQVLSGDQLQEQGVVQLSDYAKQIPGLTLIGASGPGQGQVVLRGVSAGSGAHPLVGVYLDDIPFTPSSPNSDTQGILFDPDLADVERIEVLEGPQSTLYGASSMGGVLKYVTRQPSLTAYEGEVRADGLQVDSGGAGYGVRGSGNIPIINDVVGLRGSAFYRDDPGFVDNEFTGTKNVNHDSVKGARLSLRVKFTDALETTLSGLVQNIDSSGPNLVYLNPQTLQPSLGRFAFSSPFNQPFTIANRSIADTTNLNLQFATVTNVASYANVVAKRYLDVSVFSTYIGAPPDVTGSTAPFDTESQRLSDELRLTSSPGRLEWLVGGFYTHEKDPDRFIARGSDALGVLLPTSSPYFNMETYSNTSIFEEAAGFGDLTYHFTDKVDATIGARYSSNKQSTDYTANGGLIGPPPATVGNKVDSSDSAITYLATLTYKPTPELSTYLRAASAYRPGGPNIIDPQQIAAGAPSTFGPDKLWNYEIGVKGTALDQRLSFSASAYHIRWTDIQLEIYVATGEVVANAASAKSDGVEASVELIPIDGLTVRLNGAYTDAKLTGDVPAPVNAVSGDPLPYAPKGTAAALIDYKRPLDGGISPTVGLTYAYHGSEHTSFTTSSSYELPSYQTLDLRGGIEWSRFSLVARIENVANTYALTDAVPTSATGTPLGGVIIKPRTYGISFAAKF